MILIGFNKYLPNNKRKCREINSITKNLEKEYHSLQNNINEKKEYYYSKRKLFNKRQSDNITQAALFIF